MDRSRQLGVVRRYTLRRLRAPVRIAWWIGEYWRAKRLPAVLEFVHESVELRLPRVRLRRLATVGGRASLHRHVRFSSRPLAEPLLRQVCDRLISHGIIGSSDTTIDIGCWIGDNAIPWAQRVPNGHILAIDPSAPNIAFARSVAAMNGVDNIIWHTGVCSRTDGESLRFAGNLDHATFVGDSDPGKFAGTTLSVRPYGVPSTTLDSLVVHYGLPRVGLLHVDVEGFELPVLEGAVDLIRRSRPLIIFEAHLRDDANIRAIVDLLGDFNYSCSMINEVLAGCAPDCRNFLAAPVELQERVSSVLVDVPASSSHSKATLGGPIVPIPPVAG